MLKKSRGFNSARRKKSKPEETENCKQLQPTLHVQRKNEIYYITMYPIKEDKMEILKSEEPTRPLQFKILKNRATISKDTRSIASDMEIEFSPPHATSRYRKLPDVTHAETQVKQQEIINAYKTPAYKQTKKSDKKTI